MIRHRWHRLLLIMILPIAAPFAAQGDTPNGTLGMEWWHTARMTMSSPAQSDVFGVDVGISGNWAIIGAPQDDTAAGLNAGSATFYERINDLFGARWFRRNLVTAPDGAANHRFGDHLAISGDWAVVGVPNADAAGFQSAGALYVYQRSGTNWNFHSKLQASDAEEFAGFGTAVDIDGTTIVVGDDLKQLGRGEVYVFTLNAGVWSQLALLTASDAAEGDRLGFAVAISGDVLVAGAIGVDGAVMNSGAAYVFRRSGIVWSEEQKLLPTGTAVSVFGMSVAVDGARTAIGADETDSGIGSAGAVYVFTDNAGVWSLQQRLLDSTPQPNEQFGNGVGISGTRLAVRAPGEGAIKIWEFGGASWFETARLDDNTGGVDFFNLWPAFVPNSTLDLDSNRLIAGSIAEDSFRGAAHTFEFLPATESTLTSVTPNPAPFGATVSFNVQVASDSTPPEGAISILRVADNATICSNPLAGGTASCQFTAFQVGSEDLFVFYTPTADFAGSLSLPFTLATVQAATVTTITADTPDPSLAGMPVTVSYQVAIAPGINGVSGGIRGDPTVPTGNVIVSDGIESCTGTVAAGGCTLALSTPGSRALTASYQGDANFAPSVSPPQAHQVGPGPDLALSKRQCVRRSAPGLPHSYELIVRNTGVSSATAVVVDDLLPAEVTFLAALPGPPACSQSHGVVSCNLGDLAPGAGAAVLISVTVNAAASGTLMNNASASMLEADPTPGNNSAALGTQIIDDLIFLRDFESCDGSGLAPPGPLSP